MTAKLIYLSIYLLTYMRVFVFGFVANGLPIGSSKLDKRPLGLKLDVSLLFRATTFSCCQEECHAITIQSCMTFTEKIVIAKISFKVMHSGKVMPVIY